VAFVHEEKLEWWETGLDGQDVGGGTHEAVGGPPVDFVPEGGELPSHVDGGYEGVCAIAEDGEEDRGGQSVAEVGGEADPGWGESVDRHKGRLGITQPLDEVMGIGD